VIVACALNDDAPRVPFGQGDFRLRVEESSPPARDLTVTVADTLGACGF